MWTTIFCFRKLGKWMKTPQMQETRWKYVMQLVIILCARRLILSCGVCVCVQLVVLSVAGLFRRHLDHFKCYSAFCASHQMVRQILGTHVHIDSFRIIQAYKHHFEKWYWSIIITFPHYTATGENEALINFFKARNPTTDLSLNVDSLLTKPIVVRLSAIEISACWHWVFFRSEFLDTHYFWTQCWITCRRQAKRAFS